MRTIQEAAKDLLDKCRDATAVKGGVLEVNVDNGKVVALLDVCPGGYVLPFMIKEDIKNNVLAPACADYPLVVKRKGLLGKYD